MKTKHLFYSMALAAMVSACSQEEFVSQDVNNKPAESEFAKGVPFEGEISFSKGADTRVGLDENLNYAFKEGDQVGVVWTNATAIASAIATYDWTKETVEVQKEMQELANKTISPGCSQQGIISAVKAGNLTPVDGSYVWTAKASDYKVFANTRMTYETINGASVWHMTDGQIFKGTHFAYFPYNADLQSIGKFRVQQLANQEQESASTKGTGWASHILDSKTGLVWMSQNIPASTTAYTQHLSFLYDLVAQDDESGTGKVMNVQMRPFSDILDTRIWIDKGTMNEADAKAIKIESVELIADNGAKVFATQAAFDMSNWQSPADRNGVYGEKYDNKDPKAYTWDVPGVSKAAKYTEENKVNTVTVNIKNQAENNGEEQRVQFMLLPRYFKDKATTDAETQNYTLRVNTDYGYIDLEEMTSWKTAKKTQEGVIVNPKEDPTMFKNITDETKLNTVLAKIGARATRAITFNASDLTYDNITISNTDELVEAITKWNKLNKVGVLHLIADPAGCKLDNLQWSEEARFTMNTYDLLANGQPQIDNNTFVFDQVPAEIQKFLSNTGNSVEITGNFSIGGMSAIEENGFTVATNSIVTVADGIFCITNTAQAFETLNTKEGSKFYVAHDTDAKLTLSKNSTWNGEATLYAYGNVVAKKGLTIGQKGQFWINGMMTIKANNFTNNGTVELCANAQATLGSGVSAMINNNVVNYNDVNKYPRITNNSKIVATITEANASAHRSAYLDAANAFRATNLEITGVTLNDEWNNTVNYASFKNILMKDADMKFFKSFTASNATIAIEGNVKWIENTSADASFTAKYLVLNDNATLTVEGLKAVTVNSVSMKNNTTLKGYDLFSCKNIEPTKTGNGFHNVQNSDGEEMFGE